MSRTITENLVQYLIDSSSLEENQVIDSVYFPADRVDCVMVRETGGPSRNYPDDLQRASFQVLARADSDAAARALIFTAWDTLRLAEHGVTLPASTVVTGAADLLVDQLDVSNRPYPLGMQDDLYWWSFYATAVYFIR